MSHRTGFSLGAALLFTLFLFTTDAGAQPSKVKIDQIKIGWASGEGPETRYKTGNWAPVFVTIETLKGFPLGEKLLMEVSTVDSDNVGNRYLTEVTGLEPEQKVTFMTYVRPGNMSGETSVTLHDRSGNFLVSAKPNRLSQNPLQGDSILYLAAGSRLYKFKRALYAQDRQDVRDEEVVDVGNRKFAFVDKVEQLPTRAFGYQGADVVVLTSHNDTFIKSLVEEQNQCKAALAEWVRNGGKLVISVGHNHQFVGQLLTQIEKETKQKLIDCEIQGVVLRRHLHMRGWVQQEFVEDLPAPGVEVAMLAPGKGVDVLVKEKDFQIVGDRPPKFDEVERPLIVQAPCGLGRVMLIACDIDQAPFTQWGGQTQFYQRLQKELEPRRSFRNDEDMRFQRGGMFMDEPGSQELASSLQTDLESFDDIPVVSFGWVALFIFLYILVVGPLDYLFLKKVVKRLELTWITFPVVVIVVSTLAYFTAYYLKGNDLKINKVDLVEIDLHNNRTYGSTWFTLFSPRIQNYTVGIEPATPGWAPQAAEHRTMVSWMGRPDNQWGGSGRSGGGSLFKRAYTYAPDSVALEGVPIQVWATKSFTATWEAPFPAGKPLFSSELKRVAADQGISGKITSHLPPGIDLQDVVVLYGDHVYAVERLESGVPWDLKARGNVRDWLQESLGDPYHQAQRYNRYRGPEFGGGTYQLADVMKRAMFFHKYGEHQGAGDNANLRYLDQSWRLERKNRDEAILFARSVPKPSVRAEEVTMQGVSPSRLWLGAIPNANSSRPPIPGDMLQRTFVRVYIPVN